MNNFAALIPFSPLLPWQDPTETCRGSERAATWRGEVNGWSGMEPEELWRGPRDHGGAAQGKETTPCWQPSRKPVDAVEPTACFNWVFGLGEIKCKLLSSRHSSRGEIIYFSGPYWRIGSFVLPVFCTNYIPFRRKVCYRHYRYGLLWVSNVPLSLSLPCTTISEQYQGFAFIIWFLYVLLKC